MRETFTDRLRHAWNSFMNRDPPKVFLGESYSYRPDRPRLTRGNERSILNAILTKISMDCASIEIEHVVADENGKLIETVNSGLNNCLTLSANIDQSARAFKQDMFLSMLDKGVVVVCPTVYDDECDDGNLFQVLEMRVGTVVEWYPEYVRVNIYDDATGRHKEKIVPKNMVAILENPLYPVMNEQNSTLQRLIRTLNHLDQFDEQTSAGKLDMIIQLPYVIKTEARRKDAEKRRQDIEMQLKGSKYGIAYVDGTERITQLNRPVENSYLNQIEYLMGLMYSQLGINQAVLDGTADEKTMQNYYARTVEPIVSVPVSEFKRKFLSRSARKDGQSIAYYRDPFRLVPVENVANIADSLTRNEIMSTNEVRQRIGLKPVQDSRADELRNKNINPGTNQRFADVSEDSEPVEQ